MSGNEDNITMLVRAVAFSARKHRDQRRKDAEASPYINHPIALAEVLATEGGIGDATILCAAVLHDTIEDTETTATELGTNFGYEVVSIVVEVTDDKSLDKALRKQLQIDHAPASRAKPSSSSWRTRFAICGIFSNRRLRGGRRSGRRHTSRGR